MKKYDRISCIFWFLFGVYIIREGYTYHIGTVKEPGPGFFFFWAGWVLAGLSVFTLVKAHFAEEKEFKKIWEAVQWYKPLLILVISIVYIIIFARLGFVLSTFVLMLLLFKFTGSRKWPTSLLGSFLAVFFCWLIFDVGLKCQLPKGAIENLLISWLKIRY